ncbi:unnamed protein product [Leptosia nina]|uniref:Uncharacterized protein n=1 Tax=Leptosia nina TaxID=320188 RepID=A0AAV1K463_9NEOP
MAKKRVDKSRLKIAADNSFVTMQNLRQNAQSGWLAFTLNEVTTTEQPCQDKSSFIKTDIEAIVDYMYDQLKLNDSIKDGYSTKALDVLDKHMADLDDFDKWFNEQPDHLKHIIEDIASKREFLEPKIKSIRALLEGQVAIKARLAKQWLDFDGQFRKFNRSKIICDDYCYEGAVISRKRAQENYYCGTAEEIKNISIHELTKYVNTVLKPELVNKIDALNEDYKKEIENMKTQIKDIAIKDYGRVFVDILRLQDEYIHYYQLFNVDFESYNIQLGEILLHIEGKLSHLIIAVEQHRRHCFQCAERSPVILPSKTITDAIGQSGIQNKMDVGTDLLMLVINSKTENIQIQSLNDIKHLFLDLNNKIKEIKERDMNVNTYIPVKEEIRQELDKEKQSFNELKSIVSKEWIESYLSLKGEAVLLNDRIQAVLDDVKEILALQLPLTQYVWSAALGAGPGRRVHPPSDGKGMQRPCAARSDLDASYVGDRDEVTPLIHIE